MKIGIPRAFYYHSYPGLWECFFRRLGHEPVVSPPSTQATLQKASAQTETEGCLPQKLFDGHVLSLIGKVDAVFVARIISIVRKYNCCPRFGALLDATRAGIARGVPLIPIEINETVSPLSKTLMKLARTTLGADTKTAKLAVKESIEAMAQHHRQEARRQQEQAPGKKYLLLGHPYTLNDHFIADPVIKKMAKLQAPVELMSFAGSRHIQPGDILWCVFNQMYHKLHELNTLTCAGVIQISTFNCGADSMMADRFRRVCRQKGLPYMLLMMDEHTGKAGLDTRLEAFTDSLSWQKTDKVS